MMTCLVRVNEAMEYIPPDRGGGSATSFPTSVANELESCTEIEVIDRDQVGEYATLEVLRRESGIERSDPLEGFTIEALCERFVPRDPN